MMDFDPRITPARRDIAAAHLKGKVAAERFVEATLLSIVRGRTALRTRPSAEAGLESELLFGQSFAVYETADGWCWGQADFDNCVGYVRAGDCGRPSHTPRHRVTSLATPLLAAPDPKQPARDLLPMHACVEVLNRERSFAKLASGGFVSEAHLAPLESRVKDFVAVAERFLGTPYVWGGRTHAGVDCSGLVQVALQAAGVQAPRDTDLQERALGRALEASADLSNLVRGDLVFWNGHVAIVRDSEFLLHATSFHMEVAIEPVRDAVRRIEPIAGPITSVKRL